MTVYDRRDSLAISTVFGAHQAPLQGFGQVFTYKHRLSFRKYPEPSKENPAEAGIRPAGKICFESVN